MTSPENMPREKGASLPDGAVEQADGSYVMPDETVEVPEGETDEQREQREKLLAKAKEQAESAQEAEQAPVSETASFESMPREQGTDVDGDA